MHFLKAIFFASLVFFSATQSALSNNRLIAAEVIKTITQRDINNTIIPKLLSGMLPREREIARKVPVTVIVREAVGHVVALGPSNPRIEISTGFLTLIGNLIEADLVAVRFRKVEQIGKYKSSISKYLKSYGRTIRRGEAPIQPGSFAEYAELSGAQYNAFIQSEEYDSSFSLAMRQILSVILAHEFAHHIFNHLRNIPSECIGTQISEYCLRFKRGQEDQADDYAIRVNWMLGVNPIFTANYFHMFAMIEDSLIESDHSPSACRLEKFLDAGLKFSASDPVVQSLRANNSDFQVHIDSLSDLQKMLAEMCADNGLTPITSTPGLF